ncbi:UPF0575 protein C19orf67 homolog [Xenentodon cancila]
MPDREVQVEVLLEKSPTAQTEDLSCEAPDLGFDPRHHLTEVESLLLLADAALSPPCGRHVFRSRPQLSQLERSLHSIHLQLQLLLDEANHLHDLLVSGQDHVERKALAAAVSTLLHTCQPFFNHLESAARSNMSAYNHLNVEIGSKLLDFSQQLCDRLEQLVLAYASFGLLCLDEMEPRSVSHFCIGQCRFDRLRLTTFRYCQPTPYLARANTGLYKRMRWNVERLGEEQRDEESRGTCDDRPGEAVLHTDYYFLCYEDIPSIHAEVGKDDQAAVERMWSIGKWVQVNPDPKEDDISDWIMCEVPHAAYLRLLLLGHNEPSSCSATDFLLQLLTLRHED